MKLEMSGKSCSVEPHHAFVHCVVLHLVIQNSLNSVKIVVLHVTLRLSLFNVYFYVGLTPKSAEQ